MNAISPICLADLAPALRWQRATELAPVLRHPRLADGWWLSVPLPRVLDVAGTAWLANGAAAVADEYWAHLAIGDFIPSLRGCTVELDDIAEPVSGALAGTAGSWEALLSATPQEMRTWALPAGCGRLEIIGAAVWRAVQPFGTDAASGPLPSPGLVIEAVRTVAHWIPESAPEHVRRALAYLSDATGARLGEAVAGADGPPEHPPQSAATHAIRTLRALRAQHAMDAADAEGGAEAPAPAAPFGGAVGGFGGSAPGGAPAPALADGYGGHAAAPVSGGFSAGHAAHTAAAAPDSAPAGYGGTAPAELGAHPLVDLIEELLRGWSPLERTVAAERLFAAEPISIRLLAERIGAGLKEIRTAQRSVEERLLTWLSSPDGEAIGRHLRELSERLGAATTIEQLIGAHPDHPVAVPSLDAPLWRVVITFFTDRRMHNGWLVADDPERLRWQTREMLGDAPSLADAGVRLGRIGIRQQSLRAWLLSTPGIEIRDGRVLLDPSMPPEGPAPAPAFGGAPDVSGGLPGSPPMTAGGLPIRRRPGAPAEESGGFAEAPHSGHPEHAAGHGGPAGHGPHSDGPAQGAPQGAHGVAESPRCFRAPDGRWWHRVDITADHLHGAPVTVPPGYATHLGLQPGRLLCLTAPGADLLVLVWRDEPAFDSLRPLLRRLSAQAGDRLFITVEGDRLDARRLPAADLGSQGPTGRALHLIGYTAPAGTEEALRIIARRISDLPDPDTAPQPDPRSLVEQLSSRGDADIADELRQSFSAVP